MIILTNAEKAFDKTQYSLMIELPEKQEEGELPQLYKEYPQVALYLQ